MKRQSIFEWIVIIGCGIYFFRSGNSITVWTILIFVLVLWLIGHFRGRKADKRYKDKLDDIGSTINEEVKADKKVEYIYRVVLTHHIEYGLFSEDSPGKYGEIKVNGTRHLLVRELQYSEEEEEDWYVDGDTEYEIKDEFYLTTRDDGFRYNEDDLVKFFGIEDWEWSFNGENLVPGCGIEEEDDDDTIQKKWDTYKNKFPLISSKSQFDFKTEKLNS